MAEWRSLGVAPLGAGELHFGSTLRARIEALASERRWPLAAQALALSFAPIALLAACVGSVAPPATTAGSGSQAEGYGYEFDTDSTKVAAAPAATAAPTSTSSVAGPDGRLPPEAIQTTVRAHFDAFRACYETGLKKNPKLAGTVNVKYVFGGDGLTKEAADEESTLPDRDVVECVVGEFRKLSYPKAAGGAVTVVYPIEFSP